MAAELLPQDVSRKIGDTICRYKGIPYYVTVNRDNTLNLHSLERFANLPLAHSSVRHTDPEFDYRAPRLGYMNSNGRAHYLSRIPDRHIQRQGLTSAAIQCTPHCDDDWFLGNQLHDCIMGLYPTLAEALEALDGDATSVAFGRHVALEKVNNQTVGLMYKTRLIAVHVTGNLFSVFRTSESSFLERILSKSGVVFR